MNLSSPVTELNKVGKALRDRLRHLGIDSVHDLLFYFPFRYEDYSHIVLIKDVQEWTPAFAKASAGKHVTIKGKIELIANKRSPRKRTLITEAVVADGTGQIRIVWFGQPFIAKVLKAGDEVYFSGKVTSDMFGPQMVGPAYERVKKTETTHTARIVPMYSLTQGITQKQLRFLMSQIIGLAKNIPEWLPADIRDSVDVMPLPEALRAIHFPESPDELKHAERRLKFGELFILQLRAEMIRQSLKRYQAPAIFFKEKEIKDFVAALPFQLTKDQKVAAWEILKDIQKREPMNRLLEGDVGSGKTVVAAIAMYGTVLNGYQAVIMAPTEILAQQHFNTLLGVLGDRANIVLLTRSQFLIHLISNSPNKILKSKISKKKVIEQIGSDGVSIIVGTHALLTEDVEFKNLGLVIIDEQHRFGVEQRKILRGRSSNADTVPHFLSMTATPIPRSFALTLYGDLDLSIIKEMPPGRKLIKTRLVEPHNREKAYQFVREQIRSGRQCFVVCPLIEERTKNKEQRTNKLQITSDKKPVLVEYEKLSKNIFPDFRVSYLHGKMPAKEKQKTMEQFKNGTIDILVSTSVIEVGVDIPNASVMMIEGAERFGLAQLHQFRGRVGRSEHQSYCFVFTPTPTTRLGGFTDSDSESVHERLQFFEKNIDGFALAEYDLDRRGPGEVYGTTQSGMMQLRFATLKDTVIMKLAREAARGIDFDKYPILQEKVKEWERGVHLE